MNENWYYVRDGKRVGPVPFDEVNSLYNEGHLNSQDFVWKKGFENWLKISEVSEFNIGGAVPPQISNLDLNNVDPNKKIFFIKTGADRGGSAVEYGPYSLEILKKLYHEKRINGKTLVFTSEMKDWEFLGEVEGFQDIFNELPPVITPSDHEKREAKRKPFVARMFIQNQKDVFEGICRDISIGGMQVLVNNFPVKMSDVININVHPENTEHHFVASGEVVRLLERGQGFSFRFIDLSEEARMAIESYLKY